MRVYCESKMRSGREERWRGGNVGKQYIEWDFLKIDHKNKSPN